MLFWNVPCFQKQDEWFTKAFFIFLDVLIAIALFQITKMWYPLATSIAEQEELIYTKYHQKSQKEKDLCARSEVPVFAVTPSTTPNLVAILFLFNPLSIASCVGMSTVAIPNTAIAWAIYFALKSRLSLCSLLIAVACFWTLGQPLTLMPPLFLLAKANNPKASLLLFMTTTIIAIAALFGICFLHMENWDFINESFGFHLFVRDLTPNVGLFWYLFTEMFKEFEIFYLLVLQWFVFMFAIPLVIRMNRHPFVLLWVSLMTIATWRAYPAAGDDSFALSFVPLLLVAIRELKYSFIFGIALCAAYVLAPIFWHLWIVQGSGNANFYYALNLVRASANIHMIVDTVACVLRRDYWRKHPITNEDEEGEEGETKKTQ